LRNEGSPESVVAGGHVFVHAKKSTPKYLSGQGSTIPRTKAKLWIDPHSSVHRRTDERLSAGITKVRANSQPVVKTIKLLHISIS
jgi:hypothetical protein